jgi:hypothetical protein
MLNPNSRPGGRNWRATIKLAMPLAALATMLIAAGCDETGDTQQRQQAIQLDGATSASVKLEMVAGKLTVRGGADAAQVAEADFTYNVDEWRPTVSYNVSDEHGTLKIAQPDPDDLKPWDIDDVTYTWNVQLNETVPTDLNVELGAGRNTLTLGGLDLSDLRVKTGAGDTTLDLSGDWQHDLDASIDGGAGKLTVRAPHDIGVRIDTDTGLVDTNSDGFTKQDGDYVNAAYATADVILTIHVDAGAGQVNLEVAD